MTLLGRRIDRLEAMQRTTPVRFDLSKLTDDELHLARHLTEKSQDWHHPERLATEEQEQAAALMQKIEGA